MEKFLEKGKSTGWPSVAEETAKVIEDAFIRTCDKSVRQASCWIQVAKSTVCKAEMPEVSCKVQLLHQIKFNVHHKFGDYANLISYKTELVFVLCMFFW